MSFSTVKQQKYEIRNEEMEWLCTDFPKKIKTVICSLHFGIWFLGFPACPG